MLVNLMDSLEISPGPGTRLAAPLSRTPTASPKAPGWSRTAVHEGMVQTQNNLLQWSYNRKRHAHT